MELKRGHPMISLVKFHQIVLEEMLFKINY